MSGALYGGDDTHAIVIDVGAYRTKVGYAGADTPSAAFPTLVGVVKRRKVPASEPKPESSAPGVGELAEKEEFEEIYTVGDIQTSVPVEGRELVSPLKDGKISNWKLYEKILEYCFNTVLKCDPSERCVFMSEPAWMPQEDRIKLASMLFETFNVQALFFAKSPVLSSFSNGRGTALVVDSGATYTTVTPIYDGTAVLTAMRRTQCAGDYLTQQYRNVVEKTLVQDIVLANMIASKAAVAENQPAQIVRKSSYPKVTESYINHHRNEIIRDLQISITRIAEKRFVERDLSNIPTTQYELPDGFNSNWGIERYKLAEGFFDPATFTQCDSEDLRKQTGIHRLIGQSVGACDIDIQQAMWSNIIVCGANSLHQGFVERLSHELRAVCPVDTRFKVSATPSSQERMFSAWLGGSIYASLGTFQQLWITKEAFMEDNTIIEKRCP